MTLGAHPIDELHRPPHLGPDKHAAHGPTLFHKQADIVESDLFPIGRGRA